MSVSSTTNRINYTGNGNVDTYAYTFRIFDEDDLTVTVRDPDTGFETTLTKTTHYTVSNVGELTGGNVALVAGSFDWLDAGNDLEVDWVLTIRRVLDILQETDIRNQGTFYPETHEDQFDKLVMIDQQQQDEIDRSIKFPETVVASTFDGDLPADLVGQANVVVMTNSAGDGWEVGPSASSISNAQSYATAAAASAAAALVSETAAAASAALAAAYVAETTATIANGQSSAANVTSMTVDAASYTSARFDFQIYRFTNSVFAFASGSVFLHRKNGAWVLVEGPSYGDADASPIDGAVTFSVTEAGGIAQVQYTSNTIAGTGYTGTIKFRRATFNV
jgi:hypothetical protein